MIPEVVSLVGSYLPLFEHRYEARQCRLRTPGTPSPFFAQALCAPTRQKVLIPVLWRTYDYALMNEKVPMEVLALNIKFVRHLSLVDMKHKKHEELWDALMKHEHIDRLEIHDTVFPVKRLMGLNTHKLTELKLSGNCRRMHPSLLFFVERQVYLQSLELSRFQFTASDWKRIISNKPHLRKLTISQQCEFLDYKSEQDNNVFGANVMNLSNFTDMEVDTDLEAAGTTSVNSIKKRKIDDDRAGDVGRNKRLRRSELVSVKLPDAKNFGVLPISHLVLRDNRMLLPFQKEILEACPYLEQLEIATRKIQMVTRSSTVGRGANSPHRSTRPSDVAAIKNRKDRLTRLDLDFGQGTKGKRRLTCILSILRECSELLEFTYHNHAEEKVLKEMLLRKPWDLPNFRELHLHGVSPRAKYGGITQVPSPEGWRQQYESRRGTCCSFRSFEEVHQQDNALKSPFFDAALLEHVRGLPSLSKVSITEAVYMLSE
ncbi:MAG: hypothetical protein JOS17DRAFT_786698 [Linnemannia elongata]|nr:MAG: hypothetical protein JOS17DRAFT_786698 [Linnemannia elongata]